METPGCGEAGRQRGGVTVTVTGSAGDRHVKDAGAQTDTKVQGHGPRLSKASLFTLLSLWMELFPKRDSKNENETTRCTGLVVVHERRILGLHCSSMELHAGQIAVIRHGPRLMDCELYFSRKPCSTCLKMIINAGVKLISYWPGDAEISLLGGSSSLEAELDAAAAERLRSNSRPHISVLLHPLADNMQQFVEETSRRCDFQEKICSDLPNSDLFRMQFWKNRDEFSRVFLVSEEARHRDLLSKLGLETFCLEPYFGNLRQHMRDLVRVLASVASSVPGLEESGYGFYQKDSGDPEPPPRLSQEVIRHCVIQAQLLAYRTEDPKVGVGAVIWAEGHSDQCDGTGSLYLVGCGYNAFPAGSEYGEYPQMDNKQGDRHCRKYRYIIHAEQNALTFRSVDIKVNENTMLFVTKCPCDECVPLIKGAGIRQIYTTDLDSGKDKRDISYLRFGGLSGVQKFIWQRNPQTSEVAEQLFPPTRANGCVKHSRQEPEEPEMLFHKRLRS
ncbi:cytidine and dCMP deaminase domain-containing protein 1 [Denticeps clupeoides]|uniref:Cytidine and dCMP deaminase domain-containing protein 1 n=1 Tax=Denticeps clupeoides TaxID=299321 RepID=A0AAY4EHX0_9TELE|nr:cytidine and dCMP deaminase domain-containing protein 1 [Denticeps clupeoides]